MAESEIDTHPKSIAIIVAFVLVIAIACTSGESPPSPTTAPAATSTPVPLVDDDQAVERGRAVYRQIGCAACHGEDASGTVIAPGLRNTSNNRPVLLLNIERSLRFRAFRHLSCWRPDDTSIRCLHLESVRTQGVGRRESQLHQGLISGFAASSAIF